MQNLIELEFVEEDVITSSEYQEKCIRAARKVSKFLGSAKCAPNGFVQTPEASDTNRNFNVSNQKFCRLPKLNILPFSGDPKKFLEFFNSFESAIDKNDSLSKVEKFAYLKTLLAGQALNIVSGFELSNKNYDTCIQSLKDRYGRKDIIINSFMNKILNLEPVKVASNVRALRKLFDELEIAIRNLEVMEVTAGSYSQLLIPILLKLIPDEFVLEFNRRKKSKNEVEVTELIQYIKSEIECREVSNFIANERGGFLSPGHEQNKFENRRYKKNTPTAAAFSTVVNRTCIFCDKSHEYFKCDKPVNDKILKLKNEFRCFLCFRKFHNSRQCRNRNYCRCGGRHHESICTNKYNRPQVGRNCEQNEKRVQSLEANDVKTIQNSDAISTISQCHNNLSHSKNILLQTCSVLACSDSVQKMTRIIIDQGSHRSFINDSLVKVLNLRPIRTEKIRVFSFGMESASERNYLVVVLNLRSKFKGENEIQVECLVTDKITAAPLCKPSAVTQRLMEQLGLEIADGGGSQATVVDVLIGADKAWQIVLDQRVQINDNLFAINSLFGWIPIGSEFNRNNLFSQNNSILVGNTFVMNDLRAFWELDSIGIIDNDLQEHSDRDLEIIKDFENNLQYRDCRYKTNLLWNCSSEELGNNFNEAKRRFETLKVKLKGNPEILDQYQKIIEDQVLEGIVEECPNGNIDSGYFMPHRAVIRASETTNVRIVFDASSSAKNTKSLNQCLEVGPCLLPNVLDVMLRFRRFQIAFCGDIEKAFLMIEISEQDTGFLKFLWFGTDEDTYKIMRMTRLPFGVASSPFILSATIKYHIGKYEIENRDCYEMLNSSLYVDDLFFGSDNVEDAFRLSSDAVKIFRDAGMNLRKLNSNSPELNSLWVKQGLKEDGDLTCLSKLLGMCWYTITDVIGFNFSSFKESSTDFSNCTKRSILKTVAKVYDPVGFLQPFVVQVKILLQNIWILGLDWDDMLPSDIQLSWKVWCTELSKLVNLTIPRKFFLNSARTDISMHIFTDASPKAYGAAAYFRYFIPQEGLKTSFIMAKGKVSPLKTLTLPRLELMGALLGARLGKYLRGLFRDLCEKLYFWSDSLIVIHWIKGHARDWKPFVCNRVSEIQSLSDPSQWRHCSGQENPADLLTRGESASVLTTSSLWWGGPNWLTLQESSWPTSTVEKFVDQTVTDERKSKCLSLQLSVDKEVSPFARSLFDIKRFGTLNKTYRVTAWILRFIENSKPDSDKFTGPLSALEISKAEKHWIKITQFNHYSKEMTNLLSGKTVDKSSSIFSLNPEIDKHGLLCLKGRIQYSAAGERSKHPWLLPYKDPLTELVIADCHEKVLHSAIDATLVQAREKFWIIKGRQCTKSVLRNCVICKRYNIRPGSQEVAPLPPDRILESPPFSVTGLDYAGPFFTKGSDHKHYLLLFTCAVTRALHLEIVPSMNTESFMLAFRRFVSRRGLCSKIYSDNAKSFKRADIELKKIFKCVSHPSIQEMFASYGIEWCYIVEKGPWWGGFWERMVRTIKSSLRKIIGCKTLTLNELETVFIEIEAMINSRPISYLYDDPSEPSPLTPSHFLVGKRLLSLPASRIPDKDLSGSRSSAVKRYKHQQQLLNHFWRRWRKNYLLALRSANICPPNKPSTPLKADDIVLIHNDSYPRNMWLMGKIVQVIPGRDGKVRCCVIKTKKGNIKRPVQLIYNLEIQN